MKYVIPIDVQVDLGDGIAFEGKQAEVVALLKQLELDILDALCCGCGSQVECALANAENNASREWHLRLDWNARGGFAEDDSDCVKPEGPPDV